MNKERLSFDEKIVWILTVCLIVCFTVLETYTWGRYLFLVLTVLIYFFYVYEKRKILFPVMFMKKEKFFFRLNIFRNMDCFLMDTYFCLAYGHGIKQQHLEKELQFFK